MECYYDQAFIAVRDALAERSIRVTTLPVSRAVLGHRGYTREISPDGRQPLVYDYDYVDPAPLAWLSGKLTRYGDVARPASNRRRPVLRDRPRRRDTSRVRIGAVARPGIGGWMRSYILRAVGYCKDADPFTATSDTVGPLPWRGMPAFPLAAGARRPADATYEAYLRDDQTRPAGGAESLRGESMTTSRRLDLAGRLLHPHQASAHVAIVNSAGRTGKTVLLAGSGVRDVGNLSGAGGLESDMPLAPTSSFGPEPPTSRVWPYQPFSRAARASPDDVLSAAGAAVKRGLES